MPPRLIYEHSGAAELVLEGENLTPETLKLYHNGVLYTPLVSSDTYAYYLLGDNGTNKVMLNGSNFCTVNVKDVTVPAELESNINAFQTTVNTVTGGEHVNNETVYSTCMNYPYRMSEMYPYFRFLFGGNFQAGDLDNVKIHNGTINAQYITSEGADILMNVSVIDADKPAYITYQDFIIAVFNYHA